VRSQNVFRLSDGELQGLALRPPTGPDAARNSKFMAVLAWSGVRDTIRNLITSASLQNASPQRNLRPKIDYKISTQDIKGIHLHRDG
jgi:hypothetical protein